MYIPKNARCKTEVISGQDFRGQFENLSKGLVNYHEKTQKLKARQLNLCNLATS